MLFEILYEIMKSLTTDTKLHGDGIQNVGMEKKNGVTYDVSGFIDAEKNEIHFRFEEQINFGRKGGRQFRIAFNLSDFEGFIKILKIQSEHYANR